MEDMQVVQRMDTDKTSLASLGEEKKEEAHDKLVNQWTDGQKTVLASSY